MKTRCIGSGVWLTVMVLTTAMAWAGTGRMVVSLDAGEALFTQGPDGWTIGVDGFARLAVPGMPDLPMKRFQILLPPGARATSVEVLGASSSELTGYYDLVSCEGFMPLTTSPWLEEELADLEEERRANHEAVYGSDAAYPEGIAWLSGAGTLRRYSYASVAFCPVTVHPLTGRVVIHDRVEVAIDYCTPEPGGAEAEHFELLLSDHVADDRAAEIFCNYSEMSGLYPARNEGAGSDVVYDYVIVTTANLAEAVEASTFPAWKGSLGFNLRTVLITDPEIADQPGADLEERMRNFLREYYAPWGIEYVLFVGDYGLVPMRICYPDPSSHVYDPSSPGLVAPGTPTDAYYADLSYPDVISWDLDGDGYLGEFGEDFPDFMPEVSVGRIPVNAPARITYALNKSVTFEQDEGPWKRNVLHPTSILFFENQNHSGGPMIDGATVIDSIETAFMDGWNVTHMSEQFGLVTSTFPWQAVSEASFSGHWTDGEYAVVNWAGHGWTHGAFRTFWTWDDGDGVPETANGELNSLQFISRATTALEDDHPSVVFAISCDVGFPEPNSWGRCGVDLLASPGWGSAVAVVSASRPASVTGAWAVTGGGTEQLCYDFNRYLIQEEFPVGDALYSGKYHATSIYGWQHIYEYMNLYNLNLYGDPALELAGSSVGVAGEAVSPVPVAPELSTCEPNPFSSTATLRVTLPVAGEVHAMVFDVSGRVVATIVDDTFPTGEALLVWDGRDSRGRELGDGVYFAVVEAGGDTLVRRVVLIR